MMGHLAFAILNILVIVSKFNSVVAKGPHHPRGDFSSRNKKLDEHLHVQDEHIQQDMKEMSYGEQELANMSDEEKNFYFFKLHDSDNNDHLDGLEILHAATHHSDSHARKVDRNGEDESDDNSVIDVIDDFIAYADLDQNGLLTYPEYMKAINTDDWNKKMEVNESPLELNSLN